MPSVNEIMRLAGLVGTVTDGRTLVQQLIDSLGEDNSTGRMSVVAVALAILEQKQEVMSLREEIRQAAITNGLGMSAVVDEIREFRRDLHRLLGPDDSGEASE